jgi:hypothetical protein
MIMGDATSPAGKVLVGVIGVNLFPQGQARLLKQVFRVAILRHQRRNVTIDPMLIRKEVPKKTLAVEFRRQRVRGFRPHDIASPLNLGGSSGQMPSQKKKTVSRSAVSAHHAVGIRRVYPRVYFCIVASEPV